MHDTAQQQTLLTEVIKKQIAILGPQIALSRARSVNGLTVSDDGTVTALSGDPEVVTKDLINRFLDLSGLIIKKMMEPLVKNTNPQMPEKPLPQYVPKF